MYFVDSAFKNAEQVNEKSSSKSHHPETTIIHFWRAFLHISVYSSGSQLEGSLSPREHLAISGDIFGCHNRKGVLLAFSG